MREHERAVVRRFFDELAEPADQELNKMIRSRVGYDGSYLKGVLDGWSMATTYYINQNEKE